MTRSLTGKVALVTGAAKGMVAWSVRSAPHSTRSATVGSMRVAARAGQ